MLKLTMVPAPGERVLRYVGDRLRFGLRTGKEWPRTSHTKAFLRTNLGRAEAVRTEIIKAYTGHLPLAGASWRDVPMEFWGDEWVLELPLAEVGFFKAKAYALDEQNRQIWPDGADVGISVHPDCYRTANIIYCAFVRLFGPGKDVVNSTNTSLDAAVQNLDKAGYTVIPNSGKLRDLILQVPHIMDTLGCRIIHLLPVNPTPTTYARFGRFGSPYAALDFTAVDPALVVFDKKTTGVDQFCEVTRAVHIKGGRVFLDLAINHTGWGSDYQENHPEWFLRQPDGAFASPGAWGTTWEDLCELSHRTPDLWDNLSEAFLVWCRRGVDGFRCDAGYKVPLPAWQYIVARVRQEFPDTLFLLEGLGGPWEATESLLGEGGMQWAYSELFQNYSGAEVANYLDYSLNQSQRAGLWIHYSETHDNPRLASKGRAWSLLRNRLCALTSVGGGFGYTCGVEWLATQKIAVHESSGLAWGKAENIITELKQLAHLLADHPCFFDGARLTRLSPKESAILALRRDSVDGLDRVLVLANTDTQQPQRLMISSEIYRDLGEPRTDLLGQSGPRWSFQHDGQIVFTLEPGSCYCLAAQAAPKGLRGTDYRAARARAAWALTALDTLVPDAKIGPASWQALSDVLAETGPARFLGALSNLDFELSQKDLLTALKAAIETPAYAKVVQWSLADNRKVTLVPPNHWLLLQDTSPFNAVVSLETESQVLRKSSTLIGGAQFLWFRPHQSAGLAKMTIERPCAQPNIVQADLRFLAAAPNVPTGHLLPVEGNKDVSEKGVVLFTNGLGGMARLNINLGQIQSKYDCLLAANLHPLYPVDRHVFAKRARAWVNADGFISPLDSSNLTSFSPGPPGQWHFMANAGDGRCVEIDLSVDMLDQRNATALRFSRPTHPPQRGKELAEHCQVSITVRVDIEDRNFHWETHRNPGAEQYFNTHTRLLEGRAGFEFTPALDRHLRVFSDAGQYHPAVEWCVNVPHPIEQSRGQCGSGDAYSPGWFELPLPKGKQVILTVCADQSDPPPAEINEFENRRRQANELLLARAEISPEDSIGQQLVLAINAFIAKRETGKTVIAGYPWFLDWGRDTLICARGLLAAGMLEEVKQILAIFGRFADQGTLPNAIFGADASNRETSDAPLWYGVVCEETAALAQDNFYTMAVDKHGRTITDVLLGLAQGHIQGTPTGVCMDPETALIWSPSHYTWMDTNHPAGTPREGYPVEIQALWICLLRQLNRLASTPSPEKSKKHAHETSHEHWGALADRAEASFHKLFWLPERGYLADVLLAGKGHPASKATVDNALRSNCLLAISLGLVKGERAQQCVDAAARYLVVPGALRSLAPLPVSPPLPIHGKDGRLLNNPAEPYWGHYEGEEDTRRKPAYHNGTAWTWTFPIFCEALAKAWDYEPGVTATARAYLGSIDRLLMSGCLGHLPEIVDGDAPHTQRGCDAQAWGATEALRVWKLLRQNATVKMTFQ